MEKKKSVGIITMHRVLNCGSAIQAYALQKVVKNLGFDVEIIDYQYPNKYHKDLHKIVNIRGYIKEIYGFFINIRRRINFRQFYKKFLNLSEYHYDSKEKLSLLKPHYDIYLSGSDQVWNPKSIAFDTSFMLSWVGSGKKVAYSGSFATTHIPNEYKNVYSKALAQYDSLSVREESSLSLVKELSGKNAKFVLDPALLLGPDDWNDIIQDADVHVDGEYILIYLLGYSFNIYPWAYNLISYLEKKYKRQVVILAMSRTYQYRLKNKHIVHKISPQNFLSLIANASLVVTDSFHATAMSINFQVPFYSLIKDKTSKDNRVYSLLLSMNAEDRAIVKDSSFDELPTINMNYEPINAKLQSLRKDSISYLLKSLNG